MIFPSLEVLKSRLEQYAPNVFTAGTISWAAIWST